MRVLLQNPLEKRGAGSQDHFVSLNLLVSAGKSHVSEVLLLLELMEGVADVHLEVIPTQTKLLYLKHNYFLFSSELEIERKSFVYGLYVL